MFAFKSINRQCVKGLTAGDPSYFGLSGNFSSPYGRLLNEVKKYLGAKCKHPDLKKAKTTVEKLIMRFQKDFVHIVSSKALLRANTFGQMGSPRRLFSRLFLPLGKKDTTLKVC